MCKVYLFYSQFVWQAGKNHDFSIFIKIHGKVIIQRETFFDDYKKFYCALSQNFIKFIKLNCQTKLFHKQILCVFFQNLIFSHSFLFYQHIFPLNFYFFSILKRNKKCSWLKKQIFTIRKDAANFGRVFDLLKKNNHKKSLLV